MLARSCQQFLYFSLATAYDDETLEVLNIMISLGEDRIRAHVLFLGQVIAYALTRAIKIIWPKITF